MKKNNIPSQGSHIVNNSPDGKKEKFIAFLKEIIQRFRRGNVPSRASDLAYYLLMAAIPLIFIILQVGSMILNDPQSAISNVIRQLPESTAAFLQNLLSTLAQSVSPTSIGINVVISLWLGSRGMDALIKNIHEIFSPNKTQNSLIRRSLAVVYTALIMVLLCTTIVFFVFYDRILNLIGKVFWLESLLGPLWDWTGNVLFRFTPFLIMALLFTIIYRVSSSTANAHISFRQAGIGGIFCAVAIFLTTSIYAFIMDNVSKLSVHYGSLAGILALLVWLLYICTIIVLGAEIIQAYRIIYHPEQIFSQDPMESNPSVSETSQTSTVKKRNSLILFLLQKLHPKKETSPDKVLEGTVAQTTKQEEKDDEKSNGK